MIAKCLVHAEPVATERRLFVIRCKLFEHLLIDLTLQFELLLHFVVGEVMDESSVLSCFDAEETRENHNVDQVDEWQHYERSVISTVALLIERQIRPLDVVRLDGGCQLRLLAKQLKVILVLAVRQVSSRIGTAEVLHHEVANAHVLKRYERVGRLNALFELLSLLILSPIDIVDDGF